MNHALPVRDGTLFGRDVVACAGCNRAWLARAGEVCPACQAGTLQPDEALASPELPERVVPAQVSREQLPALFRGWLRGHWLRVPGLNVVLLSERATLTWWPVWLVDATLVGEWEAERGEPYAVLSSEERLVRGTWRSREVQEMRLRFSPRLGAIDRRYDNAVAPALADAERLAGALGAWPTVEEGAPVQAVPDGPVRLPDRQPSDGWPVAEAELRARAAAHCAQALESEHVRGVSLRTEACELEWTWMLVPVWLTWYGSDAERFAVWVHGTTGQVHGPRLASRARAAWVVGLIELLAVGVATGALLFGLSALAFPPMLAVALVGLVLAVMLGILGLWPLWRAQKQRTHAQAIAAEQREPV